MMNQKKTAGRHLTKKKSHDDPLKKGKKLPYGLFYQHHFLNKDQRNKLLMWLENLTPIWEMRYSEHNPPPPGDFQRELLRPVYWLGNWQFACLNYYHPPHGIHHRCVKAEPYPVFLQEIVSRIEFIARKYLPHSFIPEEWTLNTCLINFYGVKWESGNWRDSARVGEHKDFEPGPVASLSFGERAYFQFVQGSSKLGPKNEMFSQWLEDSSLQLFSGDQWKNKVFHRIQRVEKKMGIHIGPLIENFKTRRINLTFRFVPPEHLEDFATLPETLQSDILPYIRELSQSSKFYKKLLNKK